uniref:Uncharacterized protein n=1 Tax=Oryza glumipatula TaxID=40148 RepID=A0A0D9Z7S8_9ORYZ
MAVKLGSVRAVHEARKIITSRGRFYLQLRCGRRRGDDGFAGAGSESCAGSPEGAALDLGTLDRTGCSAARARLLLPSM